MSFDLDTGFSGNAAISASQGLREAWVAAIRDSLPEGHSEAAFHAAAADQIINEIWARKSRIGVRRAFWNRIELIRTMGSAYAPLHDRVIEEFAERMSMLAGSPETPGDAHEEQPSQPTRQPEETYNGF